MFSAPIAAAEFTSAGAGGLGGEHFAAPQLREVRLKPRAKLLRSKSAKRSTLYFSPRGGDDLTVEGLCRPSGKRTLCGVYGFTTVETRGRYADESRLAATFTFTDCEVRGLLRHLRSMSFLAMTVAVR